MLVFACLIAQVSGFDESIASVRAAVSTQSVQVAEAFRLELVVTAKVGTKVSFPASTTRLGDFDIVDYRDIFDVPSDDSPEQRSWKRVMWLESLVAGKLDIPTIEIQASLGGRTEVLSTSAIPIQVESVLGEQADPTQFRDIESVVDIESPPQPSHVWLGWTLSSIAALVVGLAIVGLARRKRWITPENWAMRKLQQLRDSAAMQTVDSQQVLAALAEILRKHVEMKFPIAASVQSSDEFMQQAELHFSPATAGEYRQLLLMADEAKFAGRHLTQIQLVQAMDRATRLIESSDDGLQHAAKSSEQPAEST